MEHTCHRCGASVNEGTPFCPQCGAPQIRVSGGEPDAAATPPLPPGTPDEMQPPAQPIFRPPFPLAEPPAALDWREGLPLAVSAGIAAALFSFIPYVGFLFILWAALAAAWAVAKYHKRKPLLHMSGGIGLRLGALTGLVGGLLYAGLFTAFLLLRPGFRSTFIKEMEHRAGSQPEAQEMLRMMTSPEGFATLVTGMVVVMVVIFVGSGAIGGALAARSRK